MKKLLLIATRQFWALSTGKEITLYYNCKGLHEKYGYDIYAFCFADKKTDKKLPAPDFIYEIIYADAPKVNKSLGMIIKKSVLFGSWPLQNSLFYSSEISKRLVEYYKKVQPDALIVDMVRLVPYFDMLPDMSIPKILFEDDLLAKRYQQQLSVLGSGNVAGYFSASIPSRLNRLTNTRIVRNIVLKTEIRRLLKYEATLPQKFDYITFISPIETEEYNKRYHTDKAVTLTMGADINYCAKGMACEHKQNSLSIVGNFSYGPNAASLKWISKKILPFLPEDVVFYVVGQFPEELHQIANNPKIRFLGYVSDIRSVVKSTDIYLSPIVYGTGIKTKVVEGMAMGMPVVTNSIGAEGLNVTNGQELFIFDDSNEIINIIKKLLCDSELRDRVGRCGQAFVQKYHDWNKVYDAFSKMGL